MTILAQLEDLERQILETPGDPNLNQMIWQVFDRERLSTVPNYIGSIDEAMALAKREYDSTFMELKHSDAGWSFLNYCGDGYKQRARHFSSSNESAQLAIILSTVRYRIADERVSGLFISPEFSSKLKEIIQDIQLQVMAGHGKSSERHQLGYNIIHAIEKLLEEFSDG